MKARRPREIAAAQPRMQPTRSAALRARLMLTLGGHE
jgi:hypothetical protein